MGDGTRLMADVYRPKNVDSPLPILLMRLPYGRSIASTVVYKHPSWYADQGYIVVIQEVRGTGKSEGNFYPFRHEYQDGYDTVNWCIDQIPNNNGKLGMYGFSYQGVCQFQCAVTQPKGLITICPTMASVDLYNGFLYWGGALCWQFVLTWGLQLTQISAQNQQLLSQANNLLKYQAEVNQWLNFLPIDQLPILKDQPLADFFWDWLTNSNGNENYWQELNPRSYLEHYDLPALHIGGWADIFIEGTVNAYLEVQQFTKQPQHLIIPPYEHFPWSAQVGDRYFGKQAESFIDRLQIDWFDFWLKGIDNGITHRKPVQLFLMGANHYLGLDKFPDHPDFSKLYLHDLYELRLEPALEPCLPHIFVYDPKVPTPSTAYSFVNQSALNRRWDILVYESPPLDQPLQIAGIPEMVLFGQTNLEEWDWVIRLLDILPTGESLLVSMGVLHINLSEVDESIREDKILLRPTCHQFCQNHKIGVSIASGAFPLISRSNLNCQALRMKEGTQQVYHSGKYNSLIKLPLFCN